MRRPVNRRQAVARTKLKKPFVILLVSLGLVFVICGIITAVYPRYAEEKRLREREEPLHDLQKGIWMSDLIVSDKEGCVRVFVGKESESAPLYAVIIPVHPKDTGFLSWHNKFIKIGIKLNQEFSKNEAVFNGDYEFFILDGKKTSAAGFGRQPPPIRLTFFQDHEGQGGLQGRIRNSSGEEKEFHLRQMTGENLTSAIELWIKASGISGETLQEAEWRGKMRKLIAGNFALLPQAQPQKAPVTAAAVPEPHATSSPPTIGKKAGLNNNAVTDYTGENSPRNLKSKPALAVDDVRMFIITYYIACNHGVASDIALHRFVSDGKIWYYGSEKSYSEMVHEALEEDKQYPYQRYDVNSDSIKCTKTTDGFDVDLRFVAHKGRDAATAKTIKYRGSIRLVTRDDSFLIQRISSIEEK